MLTSVAGITKKKYGERLWKNMASTVPEPEWNARSGNRNGTCSTSPKWNHPRGELAQGYEAGNQNEFSIESSNHPIKNASLRGWAVALCKCHVLDGLDVIKC